MTTVTTIVGDAFRVSGITAVGLAPTGDEFTEGVRRLNTIVQSFVGNELGENLPTINYGTSGLTNGDAIDTDISELVDSDYFPQNSRIVFNNSGAKTLFLDPDPSDGARIQVIDNVGNFATSPITLNGNGRKIEGTATQLLNTNSLNREWFYRADLGQWNRLTDLTSISDSPFPVQFDDYLVLMLALRLNPSYGAPFGPESGAMLTRAEKQFRSRYTQERQMRVDDALSRIGPWGNYQNSFKL